MDEIAKALEDIAAMRGQMARAVEFRGFGPLILVATALIAGLGAAAQPLVVARTADAPTAYFLLWTATAVVSLALIGVEAFRRARREHFGMSDDMLFAAARQFAPAGVAGLLLSLVVLRHASEAAWMLPGLWQMFLSLGVFAASPTLPRSMILVAAWYLASGLVCLTFASGAHAFSPLAMGVPMGCGQLLAACLLHRAYQGSHDEI